MERRLLKAIINPAMIVSWILGLVLVWQGGTNRTNATYFIDDTQAPVKKS